MKDNPVMAIVREEMSRFRQSKNTSGSVKQTLDTVMLNIAERYKAEVMPSEITPENLVNSNKVIARMLIAIDSSLTALFMVMCIGIAWLAADVWWHGVIGGFIMWFAGSIYSKGNSIAMADILYKFTDDTTWKTTKEGK